MQITRIGVYGVANNGEKILTIRQKRGPYREKFDFPGGGVEFGETPEEALRREFKEEVGMEFDHFRLLTNITATFDVPKTNTNEPYTFFHIGLIYEVTGLKKVCEGEFEENWIHPSSVKEEDVSKLLWKFLKII